jgi:anaerobic selenocysteine-containing dehydrogenase
VEVMTLWAMYREHLQDYDLDTVAAITHAPIRLIEQLARDIATLSPVALHIGEGINHWFHATLANRAQFLPLMLTGNIGKLGAGCYTWAGNYKSALFQASPLTGLVSKAGWLKTPSSQTWTGWRTAKISMPTPTPKMKNLLIGTTLSAR